MNQDVLGTTAAASEYSAPAPWAPWLQRGFGGKHRRPRRTVVQLVKGMPPFPRRTLKYAGPGTPIMHGMDVEQWQRQACRKGYTLRVDGWYGPRSSKVAKSLQRRAGLADDGEIDAWTWAATWG
ncbi:peptidoglycan-binding protein [Actinomadura sp. NAK00032]|uniref:peptidoglycan-binding domain-containing protein n=1 Tax=Actinomadura sp. NAK00032 TaxID=2742128 RepID=UPI00159187C6|nr:peptidoglycan-binding protein [Actinomadura sp. NAK00032]QKW34292.1 peptidoglycan-binding protein [Actinomadura sp. NAK00032]